MTAGERPHVLIVGGFLTSPPLYWTMRDALLARGAASVSIAPVWTPDWLLAAWVGLGPLMRRTGKAVVRAYHRGGRRPLLIIGHSAGGMLARLAMSPEPYQGRRAAVAEAFGALVTLGTPHEQAIWPDRQVGAFHDAARHLTTTIPGTWFAPRTGYLSVGSRFAAGAAGDNPDVRRRTLGRIYVMIGGEVARTGWGDGLIPETTFHLDGARQITLGGVDHGQSLGSDWYGSEVALVGWWDAAVEVWQEALEFRRETAVSAS